ncbi:MAG TPA: T9SS type A sorting domain-containing protein [Bacteroidota bacterium]|nr:T9SS type A sorting domain-containing protein [Bacteroidota bacterium]
MKRAIRILAIASFLLLGVHSSRAQWIPDTLINEGKVYSFAVNGSNLFAGTDSGVFLSTDNGTSWTGVNNGLVSAPVYSFAVNGTTLFALLAGAGVYRSTDNGSTWTAVNNGITDLFDNSLGVSGTNILAGGETGHIYLSTDNGDDWTAVTSGVVSSNISSFVQSGTNLFAASYGEGVILSTDNGTTWTPATTGLFASVNCLAVLGSNLFAATDSGVFLSTNNGANWQPADSGLTLLFLPMNSLAVSGTDIYVSSYLVYKSTDNGTSWVDSSDGLPESSPVNALAVQGSFLYAGMTGGLYQHDLPVDLPVELAAFSASYTGSTIELQWKTATEINNAGFDIQRRSAGTQQWTKVGSVSGAGTSNVPHSYSFKDNVGTAGTYSYRLKQTDHNGAFSYSREIEVSIGGAPRVFGMSQNYPNPFNPSTNIQFTVPADGRATLNVYNAIGQLVATLFDGIAKAGQYNQATFDGSRFASGIYFSRLESNGRTELKKMLLLK